MSRTELTCQLINESPPFAVTRSNGVRHRALAHGIAWVTLYGALSAFTLSLLSFLVFRRKKAMHALDVY